MNIELLRTIQAAIVAEPGLYEQNSYKNVNKACGTPGSIGGWACFFNDFEFDWDTAKDLLFLDEDEAYRLMTSIDLENYDPCYGGSMAEDSWPEDLARRYVAAVSEIEKAAIAAERIDRFIATNGAE